MSKLWDTCEGCKAMKRNGNHHGVGNFPAKVMFIQDAITEEDIDAGDILSSPQGIRFKKTLEKRGINTDNCYFTSAVKCPCDGSKPTLVASAALQCKAILDAELDVVQPEIVVPMGDAAMRVITGKVGINKGRGKAMEIDGRIVLPIRHPDSADAKPQYGKHIAIDIRTLADIYQNGMPTVGEVDYVAVETVEEAILEICRLEQECLDDPELVLSFDLETTGRYTGRDTDKIVTASIGNRPNTGVAIPLYHRETPFKNSEIGRIVKRLRLLLENPDIKKEAQNGKFDILWLDAWLGIKVTNFTFDPMLAHYLAIDESPGTQGLKHMAWEFTDMGGYDNPLTEFLNTLPEHAQSNYDNVPWAILRPYAAGDVDCLQRLRPLFLPKLMENENFMRVYNEILLPMSVALYGMEKAGMYVDRERLEHLQKTYSHELEVMRGKLEAFPEVIQMERDKLSLFEERIALMSIPKSQRTSEQQKKVDTYKKYQNYKFNWGSVQQLQELLFTRLGLTTIERTDTGAPSTNDDSLIYMREQHEIPAMLQDFRAVSTQNNMFITQLEGYVDPNGLVHPSFNATGTVTGRLSSEKPNAQQFPRKSENPAEFFYWHGVKSVFTSRFGRDGVIVQFDYSQLELRIAAAISGDKKLTAAFKSGEDIHKATAASVWKLTIEQVTKALRTAAKAVNFGIIYGKSGNTLGMEQFSKDDNGKPVPEEKAKEKGRQVVKDYLDNFAQLSKWLKNTRAFAKSHKFVETMMGTRRRLPDIDSKVNAIQANAERQAINAPIQGTGSLMTLKSVAIIQRFLDGNWLNDMGCCRTMGDIIVPATVKKKVTELIKNEILSADNLAMKSRMICTVHDSIVFDVYIPELPAVAEFIKLTMEHVHEPYFDTDVPIVADMEVGYSYGTLVEMELDEVSGDIDTMRGILDEKYHTSITKAAATLREKGMSEKEIKRLTGNKGWTGNGYIAI